MSADGKMKDIDRGELIEFGKSYFSKKEVGKLIDEVLAVSGSLIKETKALGIDQGFVNHLTAVEKLIG
jgi:hypothetical protein